MDFVDTPGGPSENVLVPAALPPAGGEAEGFDQSPFTLAWQRLNPSMKTIWHDMTWRMLVVENDRSWNNPLCFAWALLANNITSASLS
jgi:hypothetical protein